MKRGGRERNPGLEGKIGREGWAIGVKKVVPFDRNGLANSRSLSTDLFPPGGTIVVLPGPVCSFLYFQL